MRLSSSAFKHQGTIPEKYSYDGDNINPPLDIEGVPEKAKSLVLIVEDPDAPKKVWVHWLVWNIPIISKIYENNIPGVQGMNDYMGHNYGGPCPPSGTHRYFFKLYAIDTKLELAPKSRKEDVEKAMEGHIVDKAELVGLFSKK